MQTKSLFSRHGLRCTAQREALYTALRACKSHPTAEELFSLVRPNVEHLSLATVYNTLESLCSVGLARKLATTSGCCRYDANMDDHLHVRLREGGEIRDVPSELSRELLEAIPKPLLGRIERKLGVRIDGVSIQLLGRTTAPGGN